LVYADPEEFFDEPNAKQEIRLRENRAARDMRRKVEQLDVLALSADRTFL
jgi:hypothetical protein